MVWLALGGCPRARKSNDKGTVLLSKDWTIDDGCLLRTAVTIPQTQELVPLRTPVQSRNALVARIKR
jgi:hypothetical protein